MVSVLSEIDGLFTLQTNRAETGTRNRTVTIEHNEPWSLSLFQTTSVDISMWYLLSIWSMYRSRPSSPALWIYHELPLKFLRLVKYIVVWNQWPFFEFLANTNRRNHSDVVVNMIANPLQRQLHHHMNITIRIHSQPVLINKLYTKSWSLWKVSQFGLGKLVNCNQILGHVADQDYMEFIN